MAQAIPGAKVIVVLREPVDRAYSHYWLNRWRGLELLDFEPALRQENARLTRDPEATQFGYFAMGDYVTQLRHLFGRFPPEQVHVTFFEDLKQHPAELVKGVCRFLGVDEVVPAVTGERHNHHGPVRSARVAMVARRLPGPLCRAVRHLNTRDGEYPSLAPATRALLDNRFTAANADLPTLLDRPIPLARVEGP